MGKPQPPRGENLRERSAIFGRVTIPVTEQHQQTGIYTSLDYKSIVRHISIDFYPPSLGDPLYEEVPTKTYSFEPPKRSVQDYETSVEK